MVVLVRCICVSDLQTDYINMIFFFEIFYEIIFVLFTLTYTESVISKYAYHDLSGVFNRSKPVFGDSALYYLNS